MTGAMAANINCLTKRKTMMMKLMRSPLENMMKIKVTKNETTYQFFFNVLSGEKNQYQARYKISHLILEHVIH